MLFGSRDFARGVKDEGSQVLVRSGMSRVLADKVAPGIQEASQTQCHVTVLDYDARGFITSVMLVIDTGSEVPHLVRLRCMTPALLGIFGVSRNAQQGTAEVSQLVALKKIYSIPTDTPFRDLVLQRVEDQQ
jgi:hypothetical protein